MENAFVIVMLAVTFGAGTCFGLAIPMFGDKWKERYSRSENISVTIETKELDAWLKNPRVKLIKKKKKVGQGLRAIIRDNPPRTDFDPGKIKRGGVSGLPRS
jgi:hypothetical protein